MQLDSQNMGNFSDSEDVSVNLTISFYKKTSNLIFEISEDYKLVHERSWFKKLYMKILRFLFYAVHRFAIRLGIKPLVKNSKFYGFLVKKGVIDKLSGKVSR